jgi:pimeloyl-ACP methyl ester carboxylesterase
VPVLLFAGGTTGLVLLGGSEPARGLFASLGETAEASGLSALAFADSIPVDAVLAADRAAALLRRLGVEQTVLVAVGGDAVAALRAAASTAFAALVLVDPRIPDDEIEALLADVPQAKLVLVGGNDAEGQTTAAAAYRHAIGPVVVQHLWGEEATAGETAAAITEATITFAIGACGDGRRA